MIVYAALRGVPDWSAPPPSLIGIAETEEQAMSLFHRRDVRHYTLEEVKASPELQAYFIIRAYDTATGRPIQ